MGQASEWVSLGEAAQIIGVHPATIRNWAERGELPFRRTPGGHRRFRRADLKQWLAAHRLIQPTEAQVVVQSALGRTRLEIGDKQKLAGVEWYVHLSPESRELMRQQGLFLMDTLIQYLGRSLTESELQTAREIGETYGKILKRDNLPLPTALDAYYYFSDFLLEAVIQMAETGLPRPATDWGDMLRRVTHFTRHVLTGMVISYLEP